MKNTYNNIINLDVVILGGGFSGVYCAKALAKSTQKKDLKIGIISQENYMVFQPMLAEVVGASISPRHVISPIRLLCKGVNVYKGIVNHIDLPNKEVEITSGLFSPNTIIKYKHLVLALGAEVDLTRVPGMTEHALLIQNVGDALHLRSTIIARIEEANVTNDLISKRKLLHFVVVGGGYSGVETAGEILDLLKDTHQYYKNVEWSDIKVTLVHSRDRILPTLSDKLATYAQNKLIQRGLNLILNTRLNTITASKVFLSDNRCLDTHTVISTIGNSPNQHIQKLANLNNLANEKGRLNTTPYLQVIGHDNVWAIGDNANTPHAGGGVCPQTAQFASRQGSKCGHNISLTLENPNAKLSRFNFTGMGELASIGHQCAVAKIGVFQISGIIAWFMWRSIYLMKLPGLERKLRIMIDWSLDLFFPKDLNLLNPRFTKLYKESNLNKGDRLFNAGDPSFSFYVVKKGSIALIDKKTKEVVRVIKEGDYFGERALFHKTGYHYDAKALEETHLVSADGMMIMPVLLASRRFRRVITKTASGITAEAELLSLKRQIDSTCWNKPVVDYMKTEVCSIDVNSTFNDAMQLFKQESHSLYPIVEGPNKILTGFLNRGDFFDYCRLPEFDMNTAKLSQLSPFNMPTLSISDTIEDAAEEMIRKARYKCFILNDIGGVIGVLSMMDLYQIKS